MWFYLKLVKIILIYLHIIYIKQNILKIKILKYFSKNCLVFGAGWVWYLFSDTNTIKLKTYQVDNSWIQLKKI